MFDAVEWFAKQGNMSYAIQIEHLRCEYWDNYDSEDARQMIIKAIDDVRADALDRYQDYVSDLDY